MSVSKSRQPKNLPPRAAAARILSNVLTKGESLTQALAPINARDPHETALIKELCFGSLRQGHRLLLLLRSLLSRTRPLDGEVQALLLIGLHQLTETRIASHAAVNETVDATKSLGKGWASGLVNGVLRRFLREVGPRLAELDHNEEGRFSHPGWLIKALRDDWPEHWPAILDANNQHPPMTLRINGQRANRDCYLAQLAAKGIGASPLAHTSSGITLDKPMSVDNLPGFAEGYCSVQDGAAQMAAELLDAQPGMRVLDACAAPGGKTAHLLELNPDLRLTAVDSDSQRLLKVEDNLTRLRLSARLICADATTTTDYWDGQFFDRILLDAPCSAIGVVRRHPDIKFLRRPDDIIPLFKLQQHLLKTVWPMLAPGGRLLYATCSILHQENGANIHAFLAGHGDAKISPLADTWGHSDGVGRQILPGEDGMDGFYYALLEKNE